MSAAGAPRRREVVDNLAQLLEVLPPHIRVELEAMENLGELVEVVLDLGRQPEARFPGGFVYLSDDFVTREDIDYVVRRVGDFGEDNRAGIERTLHRISAIRNRNGEIIGLTCRVGRAVFGVIDILRDVVETGKNILLLGRPGVGKTTLLREVARVLADEFHKRVIVVDTSNEIAGDGDVPHPGIGHARRMQVPRVDLQARVMIEAVENHMPEVIVIDEIGTEAEAQAARTIAERGVQLVATAHGNTLDNLVLNPTLSDLVGGIQAVTLGDEEARRRGTQKTVLERKAPPTFDVVVEIQDRDRLAVHHDVAATVDLMLRGVAPRPEVRVRRPDGGIEVQPAVRPAAQADAGAGEQATAAPGERGVAPGPRAGGEDGQPRLPLERAVRGAAGPAAQSGQDGEAARMGGSGAPGRPVGGSRPVRLFPYAVSLSRLQRALLSCPVPVQLVGELEQADMVLTLKGQYRKMPKRLKEAERRGLPIHVIRSNTLTQIQQFLEKQFLTDPSARALLEAQRAVEQARMLARPVELSPQSAYIRKLQHELIERYRLRSTSIGEEPNRRVLVLPEETD
ncbi:MAG TPA: R3H domain-containing nucleic acid-binding protein [Limnochordales bacterium]